MALSQPRRRFTVAEYERMGRAGILGEDDRVELIDGEVLQMAPIGSPHALCVNRVTRAFAGVVGDAVLLSIQNPIRLDGYSEPQPDVALLRAHPDLYAHGHPTPEDVLLLVEVADTSAAWERRVKVPLYARAGIQELWLVDLRRGTITVYRDPGPAGYSITRTLRRGETVAPLAFPDRPIPVSAILGEP